MAKIEGLPERGTLWVVNEVPVGGAIILTPMELRTTTLGIEALLGQRPLSLPQVQHLFEKGLVVVVEKNRAKVSQKLIQRLEGANDILLPAKSGKEAQKVKVTEMTDEEYKDLGETCVEQLQTEGDVGVSAREHSPQTNQEQLKLVTELRASLKEISLIPEKAKTRMLEIFAQMIALLNERAKEKDLEADAQRLRTKNEILKQVTELRTVHNQVLRSDIKLDRHTNDFLRQLERLYPYWNG